MTISLGPYEAHGAYGVLAESDVYDTTGVSTTFCPNCEHDPCIAALGAMTGVPVCDWLPPRMAGVLTLRQEVHDLLREASPDTLQRALARATSRLGSVADGLNNTVERRIAYDGLVSLLAFARQVEQ